MKNEKMDQMLKNAWNSLSEAQKAEAKGQASAEALEAYLKGLGIELPEPLDTELLDSVAGGFGLTGKLFADKEEIVSFFNGQKP